MSKREYKRFRLMAMAKTNGRNVHDLPAILACIGQAVERISNNKDVVKSLKIIEIGRREVAQLLKK
jgi:hypothetical protein